MLKGGVIMDVVDPEQAKTFELDGWNVKYLKPRDDADENDPQQAYLQIEASYKNRPPQVVLLTSRGRTQLDEDTIMILDFADIKNVELALLSSSVRADSAQTSLLLSADFAEVGRSGRR